MPTTPTTRTTPTTPTSDSRSRILATALRLFAARGAGATSLREVAREAGVAPGLVVHHFGGKDGLRAAVDDFVVDLFRDAVDSVPLDGPADEVVAARDRAAARMFEDNPDAVDYLRRAVVTPDPGAEDLARMLMQETIRRTQTLRDHGIARSRIPVEEQAVAVFVRQLGNLLLQPALGRLWALADASAPVPTVRVSLQRDTD
ncbi:MULTISPECIES: TetR/AcrR family transcriptional regulator [unclassified Knoellia]|uniref:TetR/AcrR family transcriptional regulator n=1 Tax=Knoellia altitudinis TaxID=3404795 RepID=UPI003615BD56